MARAIFEKWELDFAVIGHLTDTGHIVVMHGGAVEADIPLEPLAEQAPLYHRPTQDTPAPAMLGTVASPVSVIDALVAQLILETHREASVSHRSLHPPDDPNSPVSSSSMHRL